MKINDIFNEVKIMTPKEIEEFIENKPLESYTIIDVRQPSEYEESHIPGAVLMPLPELPTRYNELYPELPTIVYCRSGKRSYSAASFLKGIGFEQVYSMDGGMNAWQGLQAYGSYEIGMNLISKDMDIEELAGLAWAMEDGTGKFYSEISALIKDESLSKLLIELAKAEQRHQDNILKSIESMGENVSKVKEIIESRFKDIMEGGISLTDAIEKIKTAKPFEVSVVEFAMQIETNSLDLYLKIYNNIEDDDSKVFINAIIEEEKVHLKKLGEAIERLNS